MGIIDTSLLSGLETYKRREDVVSEVASVTLNAADIDVAHSTLPWGGWRGRGGLCLLGDGAGLFASGDEIGRFATSPTQLDVATVTNLSTVSTTAIPTFNTYPPNASLHALSQHTVLSMSTRGHLFLLNLNADLSLKESAELHLGYSGDDTEGWGVVAAGGDSNRFIAVLSRKVEGMTTERLLCFDGLGVQCELTLNGSAGESLIDAMICDTTVITLYSSVLKDEQTGEEDVLKRTICHTLCDKSFTPTPIEVDSIGTQWLDPKGRIICSFDVDYAVCQVQQNQGVVLVHKEHIPGMHLIAQTRENVAGVVISQSATHTFLLETDSFTIFSSLPSSIVGDELTCSTPSLLALAIVSEEGQSGGCLVLVLARKQLSLLKVNSVPDVTAETKEEGVDAEQRRRIAAALSAGGEW